ncbi:MAG: hypothetical protein AVDCRST_MAG90-3092, partial [uncultured Microvirga sp.]
GDRGHRENLGCGARDDAGAGRRPFGGGRGHDRFGARRRGTAGDRWRARALRVERSRKPPRRARGGPAGSDPPPCCGRSEDPRDRFPEHRPAYRRSRAPGPRRDDAEAAGLCARDARSGPRRAPRPRARREDRL